MLWNGETQGDHFTWVDGTDDGGQGVVQAWEDDQPRYGTGLPDGLFSNQKYKFRRALDGKMLIYFMAFLNILWPFGIFCVHLIKIFPVSKKNLATLLWNGIGQLMCIPILIDTQFSSHLVAKKLLKRYIFLLTF
jgi:hypothetical protein